MYIRPLVKDCLVNNVFSEEKFNKLVVELNEKLNKHKKSITKNDKIK